MCCGNGTRALQVVLEQAADAFVWLVGKARGVSVRRVDQRGSEPDTGGVVDSQPGHKLPYGPRSCADAELLCAIEVAGVALSRAFRTDNHTMMMQSSLGKVELG